MSCLTNGSLRSVLFPSSWGFLDVLLFRVSFILLLLPSGTHFVSPSVLEWGRVRRSVGPRARVPRNTDEPASSVSEERSTQPARKVQPLCLLRCCSPPPWVSRVQLSPGGTPPVWPWPLLLSGSSTSLAPERLDFVLTITAEANVKGCLALYSDVVFQEGFLLVFTSSRHVVVLASL